MKNVFEKKNLCKTYVMEGQDDGTVNGRQGDLERQMEAAIERVLEKQLAPVVEKLTNATRKEQDPSGQGGSEWL